MSGRGVRSVRYVSQYSVREGLQECQVGESGASGRGVRSFR